MKTLTINEIKETYEKRNEKGSSFELVISIKSKEFGENLVNSMQANKDILAKSIFKVSRCHDNGKFFESYMIHFKKNIAIDCIDTLFAVLPINLSQVEIY